VLQCDRVFHMDDVAVQQLRADAQPDSNIAAMLGWLKDHPGPIYTSDRARRLSGHDPVPARGRDQRSRLRLFQQHLRLCGRARDPHRGRAISMFGCDFTYPKAHDAEKGRGCVEYWLGFARARGIEICCRRTHR
jgi:hypothetical protein